MFSASPVLLVDAIETLEQLATALSEGPQERLDKELLLGIRVLLPKLRIARGLHPTGPGAPPRPYRVCTSCEE